MDNIPLPPAVSFEFEPYYCSPRLITYSSDLKKLGQKFSDEASERHNFSVLLWALQKNRILWNCKQTQVREALVKISEIQPEIWVRYEHSAVLHGKCDDGRSVTKKVTFIMAEIDKKLFHVFEKSCQRLLEPLSLEYPFALFMRRASYVKIEKAISCARNDSELLQEYLAALFLSLRRVEAESENKVELKRWIAWSLKFLSSKSSGSSDGLSESEFLLVLRISLCLAEKSGVEDENFDFSWVPALFQYPKFTSQTASKQTDSVERRSNGDTCETTAPPKLADDCMSRCDFALVVSRMISESFIRIGQTYHLNENQNDQQEQDDEHFFVIHFNSSTKCDFLNLLLSQIPFPLIFSHFQSSSQTSAQFLSLLSYSAKLIHILAETFIYTCKISFASFFCKCAEICLMALKTCCYVHSQLMLAPDFQATQYLNSLLIDTIRKILLSKSVFYFLPNIEHKEMKSNTLRNTLGVWTFMEQFDFRKFSNETAKLFISHACLRSVTSECTCFQNPHCVSTHVSEFVQNFDTICSYSAGYVQCEQDGVALLRSLVRLTENSETEKRDAHIVDFVASSLWSICFLSTHLQKTFCAHGYELLKLLTKFHPHTIDYFINWTSKHTEDHFIVSVAAKIFQYISLDSWKINHSTIFSISKFLELPSESSLNPVSRFLLNRINWEAGELTESENIQLKLEVLRIVLIRYCESVTESIERKLAAYFNDNSSKLNEKTEFALWCWQLVANLNMHVDFGYQLPLVVNQLLTESLSFVHYIHLWLYRSLDYHPLDTLQGFRNVQYLLENEFYFPVISLLDNILHNQVRDTPDVVRNLYRIFDRICLADRTFIGTSPNVKRRMLASVFVNLAQHHCDSVGYEISLKALLVDCDFAYNERLMSILDFFCNYLFYKQKLNRMLTPKLSDILMDHYTASTSKGALKDSASSKSTSSNCYQPIIQKFDPKFTYLAYACLLAQIHFEKASNFWPAIVDIAKEEIQSNCEELIYRAKLSSKITYNTTVSVDSLAISYCSKLISSCDPTNPMFLSLWRQFMLLYYHYDRTTDKFHIIGERFFKKLIGTSPVKKLAAVASKASQMSANFKSNKANYRRQLFLRTCSIWLTSSALKGSSQMGAADIPYDHDVSNMKDLVFCKKASFFAYHEFEASDIFTDAYFNQLSAGLNPDLKDVTTIGIGSQNHRSMQQVDDVANMEVGPGNKASLLEMENRGKINVAAYFEALKEPYESIANMSVDAILTRVDGYLDIVIAYSRNAFKALNELEIKINTLKLEISSQYKDVHISENVEINCNNVFRKNCTGPAIVAWKSSNFEIDGDVSENIHSLISEINRDANEIYIVELESFVDAGEKLVDLADQLVRQSQSSNSSADDSMGPVVNKVFFKCVSAVDNPKFLSFAPFSAIFEKCLITLGPNCVKTQSFSAKVLSIIVERSYLVPLLSHYFDVDQSVFVESYNRILLASSSGSLNSKMSENLLKKFHLDSWLNSLPSFVDLKNLLISLLNYFAKVGTRMSGVLSTSIPMQHFKAINLYSSEQLLEIVFPLVFEMECQTCSGLPKEFYEVFKSCCEKSLSVEEVPEIMNSLTSGLNHNDKVCFAPGEEVCENLLKPDLLRCLKIFFDQYIASLGSNLDFTTSVFHLQAVIDSAWTNLTLVFDNFWLNRNTLKLSPSKTVATQIANQIHVETFIQCANKMNISFHKIRPTLDIAYSGSRYKNALNYLLEKLVSLKIDGKTEELIHRDFAQQPFFLQLCLERVCWSILLPGPNDCKSLEKLFDNKVFHRLALHIFVSVNWASYFLQQSSMEINSANEVSKNLLLMTLKFFFNHKLENEDEKFSLLSEWNSEHESSTVDTISLGEAVVNMQDVDWSKLETENLRKVTTKWEQEMKCRKCRRLFNLADDPFVKLFFVVVQNKNNLAAQSSNGEAFLGRPHVFVETVCRAIFRITHDEMLVENIVFLMKELTRRYSVAKYLRISLLSSIFEQCAEIETKRIPKVTLATNEYLTSPNLTGDDFVWMFESVTWSISNISYLCDLAELVIEKYFIYPCLSTSKTGTEDEANWAALQEIINSTNFSNYKSIFEICAKKGHTFLLYMLSKSTHDKSVEYFVECIPKFQLLQLANEKKDYKLVVIYHRLLYLNRTTDFPVGSLSTKTNNPCKALIHLLLQVCDINLLDKLRAKLRLHASSSFSEEFRVISKCVFIYVLRNLPANLRESGQPKHKDLLESLRKFLTTFPSQSVVDYQLLIDLCVCSDSYQPVFFMLVTNFYSHCKALKALTFA